MRRKVKNRIYPKADRLYNNERVGKFINYMMWDGNKSAAEKIVYGAFDIIREKTGEDPMLVFEEALKNTGPIIEVRSRRIGGANYQVPREVRPERKIALSMRWMKEATRSKKGVATHKKLADELLAASKGEGSAVKKREDTHKMAEANKAFAHFAW
jgi:small subunit ribosomal protein S7